MKIPFWPNPVNARIIDLNLQRINELLETLGNPQLKLPPIIHFAGTNGKGSTLAFLKSILIESGFKVHSYTSPHLINFNERIILANQEITDDFLNENLMECKNSCQENLKNEVTYFEAITAAAFLAFSKVKADFLLLETGMGGRFDATNILNKVLCSVITPISFDHQEFLGNKIEEIAFEKAGIFKENCSVFSSKQIPEVRKVLIAEAKKKNCEIEFFNEDFDQSLVKLQKLPLPGNHQFENAALAIRIANFIQKEKNLVNLEIEKGLKKTFWPARLQKITSGKLVDKYLDNFEIYLDGGHNVDCAKTISEFLQSHKNQPKIALISMMKDKDLAGFVAEIEKEIDDFFIIEIESEARSLKIKEISETLLKNSINHQNCQSFEDFFAKASKIGDKKIEKPLIIICGSLYLAGKFLEENE
jgi:dihydrofolate synthase/folylpolyglutamate synthase